MERVESSFEKAAKAKELERNEEEAVINNNSNNEEELRLSILSAKEIDASIKVNKNEEENENINHNEIQLEIQSPKISKIDYMEYLGSKDKLIFLFVNPKSGSEEGKIFFNLAEKYNVSKFKENKFKLIHIDDKADKYYTYVFNIIDSEDYNRGCSLLNDYLGSTTDDNNIDSKIKIIVAGGDGTVLSIIENLNKQVDISRCIFGHIPLGTGNDLSNALGFGCIINNIYSLMLSFY
jgi:hypothetical protein